MATLEEAYNVKTMTACVDCDDLGYPHGCSSCGKFMQYGKLPREARPQVGGDHYRQGGIEPIDFIMSQGMGFCEGCIVKYVTRWRYKGGREDLLKARQYLDFLLEKDLPTP